MRSWKSIPGFIGKKGKERMDDFVLCIECEECFNCPDALRGWMGVRWD